MYGISAVTKCLLHTRSKQQVFSCICVRWRTASLLNLALALNESSCHSVTGNSFKAKARFSRERLPSLKRLLKFVHLWSASAQQCCHGPKGSRPSSSFCQYLRAGGLLPNPHVDAARWMICRKAAKSIRGCSGGTSRAWNISRRRLESCAGSQVDAWRTISWGHSRSHQRSGRRVRKKNAGLCIEYARILLSDPSARSLMASRMSSADGSPGVNLRATCTKRSRLIWFWSRAGTEAGISHKAAPLLTFTTKILCFAHPPHFWPQRAQAQVWGLVWGDSSKY